MKKCRFCIDLDGTICDTKKEGQSYIDVLPKNGAIEFLTKLHNEGHYIIIYTARHMVTMNGNLGRIIAVQGPIIIEWLKKYNIPYDELLFGKPHADFFIDDRAIKFDNWNKIQTDIKI